MKSLACIIISFLAASLFVAGCSSMNKPEMTDIEVGVDAVKVSPNIYKVLMENEHVRMVELTAKPGERDEWHSHPPMAAYFLTDAKLKLYTPDGESVEKEGKAGQSLWQERVKMHSMENIGTTDAQILLVELKNMQ